MRKTNYFILLLAMVFLAVIIGFLALVFWLLIEHPLYLLGLFAALFVISLVFTIKERINDKRNHLQ